MVVKFISSAIFTLVNFTCRTTNNTFSYVLSHKTQTGTNIYHHIWCVDFNFGPNWGIKYLLLIEVYQ